MRKLKKRTKQRLWSLIMVLFLGIGVIFGLISNNPTILLLAIGVILIGIDWEITMHREAHK